MKDGPWWQTDSVALWELREKSSGFVGGIKKAGYTPASFCGTGRGKIRGYVERI